MLFQLFLSLTIRSKREWVRERNVIKIKRDSIFMFSLSLSPTHFLLTSIKKLVLASSSSSSSEQTTKERELHNKDTLGVNSIYDFFLLSSRFFIYSSSAEWKCRFLYIFVVDTKITWDTFRRHRYCREEAVNFDCKLLLVKNLYREVKWDGFKKFKISFYHRRNWTKSSGWHKASQGSNKILL